MTGSAKPGNDRMLKRCSRISLRSIRATHSSTRPGRGRREFERHAVHAIAQAGRLRPVVEDVAEMAAAAMARYRRARHAERTVGGLVDGLVERRPKTRPAGAAFEFGLRREQRQVAAGAAEGTVAMLLEQFAGERPLGAFLAQHVVLRRRQELVPLLVSVGHLVIDGRL